jgi:YggT family protein
MNPLMRFLVRLSEPVLAPARRIIPPLGIIDISPIIVIFILNLLQAAVLGVLINSSPKF